MAETTDDSGPLVEGVSLQVATTWDGTPVAKSDFVDVSVRLDREKLVVTVTAPFYGDPPPPGSGGEMPGLWEYEVVELFLLGAHGHYLEIELGPHGHYLIFSLTAIRKIDKNLHPCQCLTTISGSHWQCTLSMATDQFPLPFSHANAYAIHGQGAARRYLAAFAVPGEKPDFHQPRFFGRLDTLHLSSGTGP